MTNVARFITWLIWNVVYVLRNRWRQETFDQYMQRTLRCRKPWRKFRPFIYHNYPAKDGNMWQMWFTDEEARTERRTIDVECHIGIESGAIVGLNVCDESLRRKGTD